MRRLAWIVTLPLLAVAVVFAVANRQTVVLDIWPFLSLGVPVYLLVLLSLFLGFLAGALVLWLSNGAGRARTRRLRARCHQLEREVARLEALQDRAAAAPSPVSTLPSPRSAGSLSGRLPAQSATSPSARAPSATAFPAGAATGGSRSSAA